MGSFLEESVDTRASARSWERRLVAAVVLVDACAALVGGVLAYLVRFSDVAVGDPRTDYLLLSAVLPVLWLGAMGFSRAYEARFLTVGHEEFRRVLVASTTVIAIVATFSWATKAEVARGYVIIALPLATVLALAGRYAVRKGLHRLRRRGLAMHRVVVVGHSRSAAELIWQVRSEVHHGMQIVGVCVADGATTTELRRLEVPVLGDFGDVVDVVRRVSADTVAVLTCPEIDGPALRRLSWSLAQTRTDLLVAPALMDVAGPRIAIRPVCGLPLLHVDEPELTGGRRVAKGLVDRVVAALTLVVLAPVLLVVGLVVRLTSPGPAIFTQARVGHRGHEFTMYKFRTMRADAEVQRESLVHLNAHGDGHLFKIPDDPRVTRVGRWLRLTSVDELPQLVNVVLGQMSLVGPRPLPAGDDPYEGDALRRLTVKPGLTGLWQISGRSDLDWDEAVRLDLRYVECWSLALDALIIWKTFFALMRRRGAY